MDSKLSPERAELHIFYCHKRSFILNKEMSDSEIREVPPAQEAPENSEILQEGEDGIYGWKFHRGPLIAALILTALFYLFVFYWVE